ncbi:MAG TPA: PASTA domain-containing protein [Solirubrobacterales bacterium]|nr:PASTA domain-containing protein [Solirubrobacterales bacterium]
MLAALLLIPAAQAAAEPTVSVEIIGDGSGEVSSVGGYGGFYETNPAIECTGPPATGTCEAEMSKEAEGPNPDVSGAALNALPDRGSTFVEWIVVTGNSELICGVLDTENPFQDRGLCIVESDGGANASVEAVFEALPEYSLSVNKTGTGSGTVTSSFGGIDCGATCSAPFYKGEKVTLTPTASSGSEFKEWTGACTGTGACEVTFDEAKSVGAVFDSTSTPSFTLSVSKSGTGSGTVTSNPSGINCGPTCSAEFTEGTVVTLTPAADSGSEFKEWTGACTGTGACEVTMSAAKSVGAKFDLEPTPEFTLSVSKSGTGSGNVTCDGGACASSYTQGTTVTLAAQAASGSSFTGWSGAGCSGTGSCVVTINADTSVTAAFRADAVSPPPPPPPVVNCVVPKVKGKSLGKAKSALKAANCAVGKVTKPKKGKPKKGKGPLVVKSTKPAAGSTHPAGTKVNLTLQHKPKKG